MYSEQRTYSNGKTMTIATDGGGVWQFLDGVTVRASSGSGQSRVRAREQGDQLAGAEPVTGWVRHGDPHPGHLVPCYEENCAGLMECHLGPDPTTRGTSAGMDEDALYLRCSADLGHVEVLKVIRS